MRVMADELREIPMVTAEQKAAPLPSKLTVSGFCFSFRRYLSLSSAQLELRQHKRVWSVKRAMIRIILFFLLISSVSFADDIAPHNAANPIVLEWINYENDTYAFVLKHPRHWVVKEYTERDYAVVSFEDMTKDEGWIKVHGNTAPVFQIEVYTIKQYDEGKAYCKQAREEGAEPSYCLRLSGVLGQNSRYVFVAYSPAGPGFNDNPADYNYDRYKIGYEALETFHVFPEK